MGPSRLIGDRGSVQRADRLRRDLGGRPGEYPPEHRRFAARARAAGRHCRVVAHLWWQPACACHYVHMGLCLRCESYMYVVLLVSLTVESPSAHLSLNLIITHYFVSVESGGRDSGGRDSGCRSMTELCLLSAVLTTCECQPHSTQFDSPRSEEQP